MKQVLIVFDIPDDETIEQDVVPKLSHCRLSATGADLFCSTPVRIIDDEDIVKDVMAILSSYNADYQPKHF